MHKVIFLSGIEDTLENFIESYKNIFLNTYTDTGIYYEDLIRKNYIDNSKKFHNEILITLEKLFQEEIILGYKDLKENKKEITITVGNFRFFVEYYEDKKEKIRFLEKVRISRK